MSAAFFIALALTSTACGAVRHLRHPARRVQSKHVFEWKELPMKTLTYLSIMLLLVAGCEFNPGPSPTSTLPPIPAPTATWSVSAQALDTVIRLTWTPVTGASRYQVYRDGASTPLNMTPLAEMTYDDIGLTNDRIYRYSIAALDANGQVVARSVEIRVAPKAP